MANTVKIEGCKFNLIEDIVSKIGSFTILNINYYDPEDDSDDLLCDIEIATKRTMIMFHDNDLVLQRIDVDEIRLFHVHSSRFKEVVIS